MYKLLAENDVKVDVIIPTYHSDDKFIRLIEMLYRQTKNQSILDPSN